MSIAMLHKGILGTKLGMTQVWDDANRVVPVTVIKAGPCVVTQVKTPESDGYAAVQLAFGVVDPRKVNKPEGGHSYRSTDTRRTIAFACQLEREIDSEDQYEPRYSNKRTTSTRRGVKKCG
jgi:ribosomal protein L3